MKRFITVMISLMMLISIGFGQGFRYRSQKSGNWNDVTTWEVNYEKNKWMNATTVPDITSKMISISRHDVVTVTSNIDVDSVTIISMGTLTLTAPMSLNSLLSNDGTLNSNGNLTLISNASETATIDGKSNGVINGNVTMQRYLPSKFGYKYFSSPFTGATVSEFGDDMDLTASFTTFYKYDENRVVNGTPASGWINYKIPTGVLEALKGYCVNFGTDATPTTVDVTGVVNNGNISLPLYNNDNKYTKGFNLVGNPYPSPIDWYASSGWTKTNIDDALYFFKASDTQQYGGEYQTLIGGVSSDGKVSRIIPSMQGFFVHVKDGAYPVEGALAMTNAVRTTNSTSVFTKGSDSNTDTKGMSLLRFTAGFTDYTKNVDYSVVYFGEKATVEFNGQTDAYKMMNSDTNVPNIYEVSPLGTKTSIKNLPFGKDTTYNISLGVKILRDGDVVIKLKDIEGEFANMNSITLYDKERNVEQDLLKGQEYVVTLKKGEYLGRFFLKFSNATTTINTFTTAVDDRTIDNSTNIFTTSYGSMKVYTDKGGDLRLYNQMGQLVADYKIADSGEYEFTPNVRGFVIANFVSGGNKVTKKLIFNN